MTAGVDMKFAGALERLQLLPWDSQHFGLRVARIVRADLDDRALSETLHLARRQDVRLVYWMTDRTRVVPETILRDHQGALVDRKVTFRADRGALAAGTGADVLPSAWHIEEYPEGRASADLVDLGIAAGVRSRFTIDPRMPAGVAAAMFAVWMQKSTRRELADVVFVATSPTSDRAAGVITVSERGGNATIGLMAVAAEVRGQGIGTWLLRAAHRWMVRRGAASATVVTQEANHGACRLYERGGYRVYQVENCFHFWPPSEA
jgi:dTDP-4-amino-4,6-dideoxy-D-galactose acyltransferase